MKKSSSLTEGSIAKGIIYFAIPLLLSNLFQQLYNSVDSVVVGRFAGSTALAAVGSTGAIINLLIGFFLGIATGTGVLYAMHYGAQDYKGLKKLIDNAMLISVLAAVVITAVGIGLSRQLLEMMDTPDDVFHESQQYLCIYLSGTVVTLIYNVGAGMIRAEGDSKHPLIYLVIGGVTNLILDLLFVAKFRMGVVGAAIATVVAQAVSAVLIVIHLMRLNSEYAFRPLKLRFDKQALWDIVRISVPCGLQGSMFNISNLLVQAKINSFGTTAMAGVTAYIKVDGFIYMPVMALGLAASTYVGQNIGAGKYERIKKGVGLCAGLAACSAAVMGYSVVFLIKYIAGFFTDDPAALQYAWQMSHFLAPFTWIYSFSEILGGAIRGAGEATKVTIITAMCICVFRVVWLSVMMHFFVDIRVVFLCYPISWFLCTGTMVLFYFKGSALRKSVNARLSAAKSK